MIRSFPDRVYTVVAFIPPGKVVSYGQIARYIQAPQSSRQVGWAMHNCPKGLPWHRVLKKTGTLPFPVGSIEFITQKELLEAEGVLFQSDDSVDLKQYEWNIETSED